MPHDTLNRLIFADDMLQFIGLFERGHCGGAATDLEGIQRLLCVCEDE